MVKKNWKLVEKIGEQIVEKNCWKNCWKKWLNKMGEKIRWKDSVKKSVENGGDVVIIIIIMGVGGSTTPRRYLSRCISVQIIWNPLPSPQQGNIYSAWRSKIMLKGLGKAKIKMKRAFSKDLNLQARIITLLQWHSFDNISP